MPKKFRSPSTHSIGSTHTTLFSFRWVKSQSEADQKYSLDRHKGVYISLLHFKFVVYPSVGRSFPLTLSTGVEISGSKIFGVEFSGVKFSKVKFSSHHNYIALMRKFLYNNFQITHYVLRCSCPTSPIIWDNNFLVKDERDIRGQNFCNNPLDQSALCK